MFSNFHNRRRRSALHRTVVRALFAAPPVADPEQHESDEDEEEDRNREEEDEEEVNLNSGQDDEIRDEIRHEAVANPCQHEVHHQSDEDEDEEILNNGRHDHREEEDEEEEFLNNGHHDHREEEDEEEEFLNNGHHDRREEEEEEQERGRREEDDDDEQSSYHLSGESISMFQIQAMVQFFLQKGIHVSHTSNIEQIQSFSCSKWSPIWVSKINWVFQLKDQP
ncbi:hypothetical protein MKW98_000425, partial [Papaver atlanticum]